MTTAGSSPARRALVVVVDDDDSVREALPDLLGELGLDALAYASAEELLEAGGPGEADALVLDVAMPGLSGPELHLELLRRGHDVPVIFITAHADAARFSQLMGQGAVACLRKPFRDTELLEALTAAIARPR